MKSLWKYRWYTLMAFFGSIAVVMLSSDLRTISIGVMGTVISLLAMILVSYSREERTLNSKVYLVGMFIFGIFLLTGYGYWAVIY